MATMTLNRELQGKPAVSSDKFIYPFEELEDFLSHIALTLVSFVSGKSFKKKRKKKKGLRR